MSKPETVLRHPLPVRLSHWLIAASGLLLTFSGIGFMPLYGRYNVNALPGMAWVTDFRLQMELHYLGATLFVATAFFHLLYHGRRREFALLPQKGDLKESRQIILALLGKGEEPPHGKFLAEQRLAYALFVVTIGVLILSGYILAVKNSFQLFIPPALLQSLVLTHHGMTYLFMLQLVLHLAAFILKANRPLLPTMFHGRIDRAYAEARHPKWRNQ